jgi:hypothetical protein
LDELEPPSEELPEELEEDDFWLSPAGKARVEIEPLIVLLSSGEADSLGDEVGEFPSIPKFFFLFSSKATLARQKLFSCSFMVDRRGNRFPQY